MPWHVHVEGKRGEGIVGEVQVGQGGREGRAGSDHGDCVSGEGEGGEGCEGGKNVVANRADLVPRSVQLRQRRGDHAEARDRIVGNVEELQMREAAHGRHPNESPAA